MAEKNNDQLTINNEVLTGTTDKVSDTDREVMDGNLFPHKGENSSENQDKIIIPQTSDDHSGLTPNIIRKTVPKDVLLETGLKITHETTLIHNRDLTFCFFTSLTVLAAAAVCGILLMLLGSSIYSGSGNCSIVDIYRIASFCILFISLIFMVISIIIDFIWLNSTTFIFRGFFNNRDKAEIFQDSCFKPLFWCTNISLVSLILSWILLTKFGNGEMICLTYASESLQREIMIGIAGLSAFKFFLLYVPEYGKLAVVTFKDLSSLAVVTFKDLSSLSKSAITEKFALPKSYVIIQDETMETGSHKTKSDESKLMQEKQDTTKKVVEEETNTVHCDLGDLATIHDMKLDP